MIGRLLYQLRTRFKHGIRAAWYRDLVRPRILNSPPVVGLEDRTCEIHVLTSDDDWLNLLWTLKSFYQFANCKYGLVIHDDGSLSVESKHELQAHFPDARLIDKQIADQTVLPSLDAFPNCQAFRKSNHLAPKIFDFRHYLNSKRMLLLDSDVLFFDYPQALIERIESNVYSKNTVNSDVATAYTVDPEAANKQCNVQLPDRFNSGLGLIHADSLNLDWFEEFLSLPNILGHFWRIEQTLLALCSSRFGVELLPREYDVFLKGRLSDQPSRHYVGAIRHEMYREGIKKLYHSGFLRPRTATQPAST